MNWVKRLFGAVLLIAVGFGVYWSLHWPLVGDAALMHYVVFMISQGHVPYRDIIDINLPGSHLSEMLAMKIFGWGALGWRIYDLILMLLFGVGVFVALQRTQFFATVFASCLFALFHMQDGIAQLGQRDLLIAVLVIWGYAFASLAERHLELLSLFLSNLCFGLAATIKPPVIVLGVVLLLVRAYAEKRRDKRFVLGGSIGLVGLTIPGALMALWLWKLGALSAFLQISRSLIPLHTSLGRKPLAFLLAHSISPIGALVALWVMMTITARVKFSLERAQLLIGISSTLLIYLLQGKGYPYHRYPLLALLLLTISIDLEQVLGRNRVSKVLAIVTIAAGTLIMAPRAALNVHSYINSTPFEDALSLQLRSLHTPISGDIQCLDTFSGCLNTLYNLRAVQSTGFLYDCYLYKENESGTTNAYRRDFLKAFKDASPKYVVVTAQFCFSEPEGFKKIEHWPALSAELQGSYQLVNAWTPKSPERWWSRDEMPASFRLYEKVGESKIHKHNLDRFDINSLTSK